MTNTSDTSAQLSDLIGSVEARITTLQHERQALVTQLQDIRRTAERLLLALVGRAEAPRGRPRTKAAIAGAKRTVSPATRKKMATAATRRWAAKRDEGA